MLVFRRPQDGLGIAASAKTRRKTPIHSIVVSSLLLLLGASVTFLEPKLPLDMITRSLVSSPQSNIVRRHCSASFRPRGEAEGGSRNENDAISSMFAASFPGSGSQMTWNLINALTGQATSDEFQMRDGREEVVSIKAHWPHPHGSDVEDLESKPWAARVDRAFVLLRHPLDAIPSLHNYLYEQEKRLAGHSTRAPPEAWVRWRDVPGETFCSRNKDHGYSDGRTVRAYGASEAPEGTSWDWRQCAKTCGAEAECEFWNLRIGGRMAAAGPNECRLMADEGSFHSHQGYRSGQRHPDCVVQSKIEEQLRIWERFVTFWMDRHRPEDRLVISYEDMIHDDWGPETAKALASFLFEAEGVQMVEDGDVPCVWETIVKYKSRISEGEAAVVNPQSQRSGPKERPYNKEHLDATKAMLERLKERYANEVQLVPILDAYLRVVDKKIYRMNIDEGRKATA